MPWGSTHVEDKLFWHCKTNCNNFLMNFLFWNYEGAGNNEFCALVHDLRRLYHYHIMAVVEPRVIGVRVDKIVEKLKFKSQFRVEAQGISGGIWLLWNHSRININILDSSMHFIHGIVNEGSIDSWLFTVVYADPIACLKKQCFEEVAKLAKSVSLPWMVIGDFNEILMVAEKVGELVWII